MNKRYGLTGLFLTFFLVVGMLAFQNIFLQLDIPNAYAETEKTKGPVDAPIQLVEYSDFQCPACRYAQNIVHEFEETYAGQIRVIYRNFPLSGHEWSAVAHPCAECAGEQGKFWEYHDMLFEHQAKWSGPKDPTPVFLGYAQQLGLNLDQFAECLADESVRDRIAIEKQQGLDLKVRSTPTFFINGERFVGGKDLKQNGEKLIRKTLNLPELPEPAAA